MNNVNFLKLLVLAFFISGLVCAFYEHFAASYILLFIGGCAWSELPNDDTETEVLS